MSERYEDDENALEVIEPNATGGTLAILSKAEIDMQITTAKTYPRDMRRFVNKAASWATMTEQVAGECFYRLSRKSRDGGNKVIEGPSVRLAEIVVAAWGNCRASSRVIEEGDRYVTAEGSFIDLENNVAIKCEVRRRITDRNGRRYNDDMILTTSNAACSIALRNAITRGIPRALWEDVYEQAVHCYKGDAKTLPERRTAMIEYFKKFGVTEEQLWTKCGKRSTEGIDLDDLLTLRGIATAIKDGETSIENAFAEQDEEGRETSAVAAKLSQPAKPEPEKGKKKTPAKTPDTPSVSPEPKPEPETPSAAETAQEPPQDAQDEKATELPPATNDEDAEVAAWVEEVNRLTTVESVQNAQWTIPNVASAAAKKSMRAAASKRLKEIQTNVR